MHDMEADVADQLLARAQRRAQQQLQQALGGTRPMRRWPARFKGAPRHIAKTCSRRVMASNGRVQSSPV